MACTALAWVHFLAWKCLHVIDAAKNQKPKTNKNFCFAKDSVKRIKRHNIYCEKIFAKDTSDKGLVSKIYKEFLKLNTKKITNRL